MCIYIKVFTLSMLHCFTKVTAEQISNGSTYSNVNLEPSVNDIAESLLYVLGVSDNGTESTRLQDLREKLAKVGSYVVDKASYSDLIINSTRQTNLNSTNFYMALNDNDNSYLLGNHSEKNLFLKLKEKMNREDILKVLSEKTSGDLLKSARRSLAGKPPKRISDKQLSDVIDKMLAETPNDGHKYGEEEKYNKYWDPQVELKERQSKRSGRRIYKGERTTIRYYPFMASIHVMGRFWCGGVLYWHDLVLTSASCVQLMHNNRFFRENPKVLSVRVGSNHSRISGELVDAMEVYFHPGYNPRTLRNNLALIRLRRHLRFNYHRVPKIIAISTTPDSLPFTGEVIVLGWGVTKTSQKLAYEPIFLQRKFLPVYPNKFCKEVYGDKFISESMFCAGTFTTGEGACDHDAGGPAILDGKLVGIISFGPTVCGYPNTPTVFTHIGAFSDWIETINETIPGYYRGAHRTTTTTSFPWLDYFQSATAFNDPSTPQPSAGQGGGDRVTGKDGESLIISDGTTQTPTPEQAPKVLRTEDQVPSLNLLDLRDSDVSLNVDFKP